MPSIHSSVSIITSGVEDGVTSMRLRVKLKLRAVKHTWCIQTHSVTWLMVYMSTRVRDFATMVNLLENCYDYNPAHVHCWIMALNYKWFAFGQHGVNVTGKISATLGSSSWNLILLLGLFIHSKYRPFDTKRLHAGPSQLHPPRTLTFPSPESSYRLDRSKRSTEVTMSRHRPEEKVRGQIKASNTNVMLSCNC